MNTGTLLAAPLLLLSLAPRIDGCGTPPATCDNIQLSVDVAGMTTVVNANLDPISFALEISSYQCSSSGCTWYGSYPQEALAAGQTGSYVADIAPEFCTDQYCCGGEGFIAHAVAELTLLETGCKLTATADRDTCEGTD